MGSRSITLRLTALYGVTTLIVLVICGLALYWFLMRSFEAEDGRYLAAKVHELRTDFADDGNRTARLEQEIRTETGTARFREYYARLISRGKLIGETPGMHSRLPRSLFPSAQSYVSFAGNPRVVEADRNRPYLLASVVLGRDAASNRPLTLQLAVDVSRDRAVLADYRNTLLAVFALGTLIAAMLGVWAARRGLAPLREMTRVIETTSAERLEGGSFEVRNWPRELRGLAEAFERMLARLADSFERLRQFSADVAHELRTPLGNLRGEAEVALTQTRTAEGYRAVVESMHEEGLRLTRIVESLLFLARAEQGQAQPRLERLELATCVESILEYFRPLAEEKRIALSQRGRARIAADAELVQRAVGNLVSNAIRYTPAGGSIAVTIERPANGHTLLRVTDTGCGIAKEHLPRLFDRFYRVDAARLDAARGSGLGLSIVKSIMMLHGGSIDVASRTGEGTSVTLDFPAEA